MFCFEDAVDFVCLQAFNSRTVLRCKSVVVAFLLCFCTPGMYVSGIACRRVALQVDVCRAFLSVRVCQLC